MSRGADPILQALLEAAATTLGADGGAIAARSASGADIVGAFGQTAHSVGAEVGDDAETLGFVLGSAQPTAAVEDDTPILCVPCLTGDGVVGALELVRDPGREPFGAEALDSAAALASVAAAVIAGSDERRIVVSAAELGAELARLEAADPLRYATVAQLTQALLAHG